VPYNDAVRHFREQNSPHKRTDVAETALSTIERLEQLAAWHRLNADHAGSTWIWDVRLQMVEDLERQAAQLRALLLPDNMSAP
jgi:hypothetical protein